MFIYNLKLSKSKCSKLFISTAIIIILAILVFSIYLIFFKGNTLNNNEKSNDILDLNETNYTNVLKASNENIDSYIGLKVRITGYVYRLLDFDKNEFVIARDMRFGENSESLVVGFLCNYDNTSSFEDGAWVQVVGEIKKGNFNGDIAILDVISIERTSAPENIYVNPPDKTYLPTVSTGCY